MPAVPAHASIDCIWTEMVWHRIGFGVQKLFYLPEAHTDFLFAVMAEELGLVGVCVVVLLVGLLALRGLAIGPELA